MTGIQGRVKDIGRMSTFAQRDLDGIFFVGFSPAIVTLVQLEPTRGINSPFQSLHGKDMRYMGLSRPARYDQRAVLCKKKACLLTA